MLKLRSGIGNRHSTCTSTPTRRASASLRRRLILTACTTKQRTKTPHNTTTNRVIATGDRRCRRTNNSTSTKYNKASNDCEFQQRPTLYNKIQYKVTAILQLPIEINQPVLSGVHRHSDKHATGTSPKAQCAFKILMIHEVLQFALRIAFRCVLHRCGNLDIHR